MKEQIADSFRQNTNHYMRVNRDRQAKFATTITGACTGTSIASMFEAASFRAQGMLHRILSHAGKAVFFSKEWASLVCGDSAFAIDVGGFSRRYPIRCVIVTGLFEHPIRKSFAAG